VDGHGGRLKKQSPILKELSLGFSNLQGGAEIREWMDGVKSLRVEGIVFCSMIPVRSIKKAATRHFDTTAVFEA